MISWQGLANPTRFLRFSKRLLTPLWLLTMITFAIGLYYSFFNSPMDYQQGNTVRIMYIHVPAAYMATLLYFLLSILCFLFLIYKHLLADIIARAIAVIGACFTLICLITGSLWGKPMWGTWWVWDARLTSVLILFFLYCGYMALAHSFEDTKKGSKQAAILGLVGGINLPIIKFSVDWWNTLHQPASLIRIGGPKIDIQILVPLLWMMGAFTLLAGLLVLLYSRALIMEKLIAAKKHAHH